MTRLSIVLAVVWWQEVTAWYDTSSLEVCHQEDWQAMEGVEKVSI